MYTRLKARCKRGYVAIRHTASSKSNTTVTTTLKAGTNTYTFKSTTLVVDSTPDPISFTPQTGVSLSSLVESAVVTVSGINTTLALSITGGNTVSMVGVYQG
ncbi:hypothetical protein [Thiothrix fructosivorans]|uniref:Uncharacterized protein n=1 Tax=Thiothrix fructosivorans TaxID=111770 RepID=A0ABS3IQY0_9GAMM|nr:hypothetical protein [Thiothrix fructosivorans]MBO0615423.1 hypothetical protein [Thiothrix fructosivorans]